MKKDALFTSHRLLYRDGMALAVYLDVTATTGFTRAGRNHSNQREDKSDENS